VLGAGGVPAVREHLDLQAAAAVSAVAWRLQRPLPYALDVRTFAERPTAPVTPQGTVGGHSVADRAFTGIARSASRARSSLAGRPNVVR